MPGMQVKSENRSLTYPRYIQGEIAPLGRPAGYQGSPGVVWIRGYMCFLVMSVAEAQI